MSRVTSSIKLEVGVTITLTEEEVRALKAITEYGVSAFLEVFYKYLGKGALKPHEEGLKSLFELVKVEFPKQIVKMDKIYKELM